MNFSAITHKFDGNVCKLKIPIAKTLDNIENCDVFVDERNFIFVADVDVKRFNCPRRFDIKDMKNIPIAFDTDKREYTCRLPCYPEESKADCIEKGELDKIDSQAKLPDLRTLSRITDSCVLTVDGVVCDIQADFSYGFGGRFRGKLNSSDVDALSGVCRITNPSLFSPIRRTIKREKDETKDFCPDQYKLNFVELQIPDGHENPIKYHMCFDDYILTKDEESILHNIVTRDFSLKLDSKQINIDCGLISILLAICYDVRTTSNDPTCECAWTRTILSSALTYFERFENLSCVVDSFLRRSLIYPLYRNYDLGRLCVEDAVEALQRGKLWIVKQLVATYNCFLQSELDRESLNKYFMKDYVRYVAKVLDNDHLQMLSRNLKNVLLDANKKQLRLGLGEIEKELLKELIKDIHVMGVSSEPEGELSADEDNSDTDESEEEGSVIEKTI